MISLIKKLLLLFSAFLLILSCSDKATKSVNDFKLFSPNVNRTLSDLVVFDLEQAENIDMDILTYKKKDTILCFHVDSLNNRITSETWFIPLGHLDSNEIVTFLGYYGTILTPIDFNNIGSYEKGNYEQFCFQSLASNRIFICNLLEEDNERKLVVRYDFIKEFP